MRSALIVSIFLVLTGAADAQRASALSDGAILRALIGNTIIGTENKKPYIEYLRPDGWISGQSNGEAYTGAWQIYHDQLCFYYYEEIPKMRWWECSKLALQGTRVLWIDDNTTSFLLRGNPYGL